MLETDRSSWWWRWAAAGGFGVFVVAALCNSGGYRYGVSDQAFYIPAVLRHLDPSLFPRDWAVLLAPQDRFNVFTPAIAALARLTRLPVPVVFAGLHLTALLTLFLAVLGIGSALYRSRWTTVALAAALTLRHAVALGAVNTLEGYMHPRLLAFAVGSLAVAAFLTRRRLAAALLLPVALAIHPTTAAWFTLWIAVAFVASDRRYWRPALAVGVGAAAVAAWAVLAGPLAGRLRTMDPLWLSVLGQKKYLFPTAWPIGGWLPAVLTPLAAGWLYTRRQAEGLVTDAERGIAAGAAVLVAAFLASLPFTAARLALAVQLQVPRVLWMVDLLALVYVVWYMAEGARWARHGVAARTARTTAIVLVALSLARGGYVMFVQHASRPVVQMDLPATAWTDAMRWVEANTPKDAWVLAAPGHAWKYGASVRVAARRDVYLEEAKDTAMAMYSREAAMTVLERIPRAAPFDDLTADAARALAREAGPDVMVTEKDLALPLMYRNTTFKVYRLK